jgi:hypothetical protein
MRVTIPPDFFMALAEVGEFQDLMQTSRLNASQCVRLWQHLGRTDMPPDWLDVRIRRSPLFPPEKPGRA